MDLDLLARVREEGGLETGRPVVVLLSGGRDSVCLLDLAVRLAGPAAVSALHVDYGLRDDAGADERLCRRTCGAMGVPLNVHRPRRPEGSGNLQAWARDQRYAAAARLALRARADVATGHTATDQVETVLYRLAASPGRRALLGMPVRDGRLVRPLLGCTREETATHCRARGLEWREDPSNEHDEYARNRVRHGLVPALRAVHPGAEDNVLRTLDVLRDEALVLDAAVEEALRATARDGGHDVAALAALPAALARLALQRLADAAAPGRAPAIGRRAPEILALGAGGGTAALDLGGDLRAVVEYGVVRLAARARRGSGSDRLAGPAPATLTVPGRTAFGVGELSGERGAGLPVGDGVLDAAALAPELEVRAWRTGDRMRPLGLAGSTTVADLFTDRKVPRERRRGLPLVLSDGEIAWIPGVATGERFRVTPATRDRVRLSWRPDRRPAPPR